MKTGETIGRYEILVPLARGGMAEVWLARSKGENGFTKNLVVKTILPHLADDAQFEKMFVNEALLASRLNHPNVVQILDLGKDGGRYFIVMEYVHGVSLRQVARAYAAQKRVVPPWFVLRTTAAVCEGLQHAHELCDDDGTPLGLVHRDVSPENVMISRTGLVKVLDFGVAKATSAASQTKAGTLKGKYSYLPPELIHGLPPDPRCDVYAVGVMLFECLTGRRPYVGANDLELLKRIIEGNPPSLNQLAPWMQEPLQQLILRAMHRDAASRYGSARELADALNQVLLQVMKDNHTTRQLGEFVNAVFPQAAEPKPSLYTPAPNPSPSLIFRTPAVAIEMPGSFSGPSPVPLPISPPAVPPTPLPQAEPQAPTFPLPSAPSPSRGLMSSEPSRLISKGGGLAALLTGGGRKALEGNESGSVAPASPASSSPENRPRQRPAWLVGSREVTPARVSEDSSMPAWLQRKKETTLAKQLFGTVAAPPVVERVHVPMAEDDESLAAPQLDLDAARIIEAEQHLEWGQAFEREGHGALAAEEYERAEVLAPGRTPAEHYLRRLHLSNSGTDPRKTKEDPS